MQTGPTNMQDNYIKQIDELEDWFKKELNKIHYRLDSQGNIQTYNAMFTQIPRSEYTLVLFSELNYTPPKGYEPSWVQRKLMEWCFGVRWKKRSQEKLQ